MTVIILVIYHWYHPNSQGSLRLDVVPEQNWMGYLVRHLQWETKKKGNLPKPLGRLLYRIKYTHPHTAGASDL